MKLLFVRHGVAEERETAGKIGAPDELRALTSDGRKKFRKIAAGLRESVDELALVAVSPLLRAVQTAEILAHRFGDTPLVETVSLAPGAMPSMLLDWLREHGDGNTVALVGHEPDLGHWVSWACAGAAESFLPLKKGGACLIEFMDELQPGTAVMHWALTPRQLRRLATK